MACTPSKRLVLVAGLEGLAAVPHNAAIHLVVEAHARVIRLSPPLHKPVVASDQNSVLDPRVVVQPLSGATSHISVGGGHTYSERASAKAEVLASNTYPSPPLTSSTSLRTVPLPGVGAEEYSPMLPRSIDSIEGEDPTLSSPESEDLSPVQHPLLPSPPYSPESTSPITTRDREALATPSNQSDEHLLRSPMLTHLGLTFEDDFDSRDGPEYLGRDTFGDLDVALVDKEHSILEPLEGLGLEHPFGDSDCRIVTDALNLELYNCGDWYGDRSSENSLMNVMSPLPPQTVSSTVASDQFKPDIGSLEVDDAPGTDSNGNYLETSSLGAPFLTAQTATNSFPISEPTYTKCPDDHSDRVPSDSAKPPQTHNYSDNDKYVTGWHPTNEPGARQDFHSLPSSSESHSLEQSSSGPPKPAMLLTQSISAYQQAIPGHYYGHIAERSERYNLYGGMQSLTLRENSPAMIGRGYVRLDQATTTRAFGEGPLPLRPSSPSRRSFICLPAPDLCNDDPDDAARRSNSAPPAIEHSTADEATTFAGSDNCPQCDEAAPLRSPESLQTPRYLPVAIPFESSPPAHSLLFSDTDLPLLPPSPPRSPTPGERPETLQAFEERKVRALRRYSLDAERAARDREEQLTNYITSLTTSLSLSPDPTPKFAYAGRISSAHLRRRELYMAIQERADVRRLRRKEKERSRELGALLYFKTGEMVLDGMDINQSSYDVSDDNLRRDDSDELSEPEDVEEEYDDVVDGISQLVAQMILRHRDTTTKPLSGATRWNGQRPHRKSPLSQCTPVCSI